VTAYTLTPLIPMFRRRGRNPYGYAIKNPDLMTVAIVRKRVGRWTVGPPYINGMHTMFPSRIHSRGTAYKSFPTVAALRTWIRTTDLTQWFR